ncbi:O-antigen ligase family protein [Leptolyngbyaceae cyanobacterium UHCC 1019]
MNVFNFFAGSPNSDAGASKLGALSRTEKVLYWTIVLMPVWWLLGIQTLFYPFVLIALLVTSFKFDKLIQTPFPMAIWAWFAMSMVMLWTALLGINEMGFKILTLAAAIVTFSKSYFLIFACLAIPFWSEVRITVITRAVAWLSTGYLGTLAIEMILLPVTINMEPILPPLARLIPADKGSLTIQLATMSSFFGVPLPRSILYVPDPPILGISAVICFIICLGEPNRRLRRWSLAGSLAALIISFSRSSWLALPLALLISLSFNSSLTRQLSLWIASMVSLLSSVLGLTLADLVEKPMEVFDSARSESSGERSLVVRKTLEAWLEAPWLGWGVIRGQAHLYEDVYIGLASFSTYSAVLYLHGVVGFSVFVVSLILTLWFFFTPAVKGNLLCRRAFGCLIALYLGLNATPLSWMAVYFWYFFVWLGVIIKEVHQQSPISSWDELSKHGSAE